MKNNRLTRNTTGKPLEKQNYSSIPFKNKDIDRFKKVMVNWPDNILNPKNAEFVNEVAFNNGINVNKVTQKMFNDRYLKKD
jgi:hypothetical protein